MTPHPSAYGCHLPLEGNGVICRKRQATDEVLNTRFFDTLLQDLCEQGAPRRSARTARALRRLRLGFRLRNRYAISPLKMTREGTRGVRLAVR